MSNNVNNSDSGKEFLLEFFSEEIPARFHRSAIDDARATFVKVLKHFGMQYSSCEALVSPRRIAIVVTGMNQNDNQCETKRGPRIDAKKEFIDGFLRSNNVQINDLIKDGEYYYIKVHKEYKDITSYIKLMISKFIETMPWKKSMRWYLENECKQSAYWVRPVRSILCIYDGKPVDIYVEEFGIRVSNKTYGHRFLSGNAELIISNYDDYCKQLENNYVLIDFYKKRSYIDTEIRQHAVNMGAIIQDDDDLLDEVCGLVEYPFIHTGQIEERFMHLPQLFITTVLKMHQKFFTMTYPDSLLSPFYIAVINVPVTDDIKLGLQKVTNSRLTDATFFYKADTDLTFDDFALRLSNIVFHEKLGTIAQKVARMMLLTNNKNEIRAISICKADLATEIVGEMPELQGKAGEIYARHHGEDEDVCTAIKEHYQPNGINDVLPNTIIGARLSLFDKLDTLVGFFGVGIYPTGSKDQFALRRAAYCIVRLLCDFRSNDGADDFNILKNETILDYINWLIDAYTEQGITLLPDTCNEVLNFIIDRLKVFMNTNNKIPKNIIDIVICSYGGNAFCYKTAFERCKALHTFMERDESKLEIIKMAYRRAKGITDGVGDRNIKSIKYDDGSLCQLQKHLLLLHETYNKENIVYNNDLYNEISSISEQLINVCDNVCIKVEDEKKCSENIALINEFIYCVNLYIGNLDVQ